jgi:hypothetical protein
MKLVFSICVLCLLLFSCSLERTNPLDPKGEGDRVPTPPDILGVALEPQPRSMEISWNRAKCEYVELYYVYKGNTASDVFVWIAEVEQGTSNRITYRDGGLTPGLPYFYRISAVTRKIDGDRRLEGKLSDPVGRHSQ